MCALANAPALDQIDNAQENDRADDRGNEPREPVGFAAYPTSGSSSLPMSAPIMPTTTFKTMPIEASRRMTMLAEPAGDTTDDDSD